MDAKTQATLAKISQNVPKHLAGNVTKVVVDDSGEEIARLALKDSEISPKKKEKINALLKAGKFRSESVETNEEVVAEIDKYNQREVDKARRHGALKDPMTDPFYRERMKRIANGNPKKATPYDKAEIARARALLKPKK
jgi:hypothetical protein